MTNYYYDPDKSGLELLSFEDPNLSYEFDILAFWATKDGVVYSASDSGCSCPTPFDEYTSLDQLERVGSVEQAKAIFKGWNANCSTKLDSSDQRKLTRWIKARLKK